jgi:hypothetical protein
MLLTDALIILIVKYNVRQYASRADARMRPSAGPVSDIFAPDLPVTHRGFTAIAESAEV